MLFIDSRVGDKKRAGCRVILEDRQCDIGQMLHHDDDLLLTLIDELEHPNVKIYGDKIIVFPSDDAEHTFAIYIASFNLNQLSLPSFVEWPRELIREAGIVRPVVLIDTYNMDYCAGAAPAWLKSKLITYSTVKEYYKLWTPELMMEYAVHMLESPRSDYS